MINPLTWSLRGTAAAALVALPVLLGLALGTAPAAAQAPEVKPVHAMAMHGEPKYGPGFEHFAYVNPQAPKGGQLRMFAVGSFDNLNPFILRGSAAVGSGLAYDALLTSSADEAFTEYGLIVESLEVPEDRSWVIFTLRPEARFHDGHPITADDVVFTFNVLKEKGAPHYRFYYADVAKVETLGERRVKFTFGGGVNQELPLIIGQMPVLPEHYWKDRDFAATTLEPPLGSGPYRVKSFEPGRFIVYERVKDWWGKDLAVSKGFYNFDEIRYDYFRDTTVALEAFKSGAYDLRVENIAKEWATGYDFPARAQGRVILREFEHDMPSGMQGFAFNLRRPLFQDARVRQALAHAFDFEWSNQNLFYGQYRRTGSYFDNSELASDGPPGPAELALLEPLRGTVPDDVFTKVYEPPSTQAAGGLRANLRIAMALLKEAGWEVRDGALVNGQTGQPFVFEILLSSPTWERISLPFAQNLKRLGIQANVRTVDSAQYENRMNSFDFDMAVTVWGQSLSPGNEQRNYWGSEAAGQEGSQNYAGIQSPAIDALIAKVITAGDRDDLITAVKAMDRVLLWNHLVIPHWHIPYTRVAFWDKFGMPADVPMQGVQLFSWWYDAARGPQAEAEQRKAAATEQEKQ
ncbi:extracellular solute-binding protein [Novispirillum sp. DQ9]|uniref:extracellular solute-binding protein n=1 Tax=Novispirillum sp. DQ9 TaxID=3398612 RepID=UPI003C7AD6D5